MPDPWEGIEDPVELFLRDTQDNGLENSLVRRYYSKYEALVISNKDPQQQGRVLLRVYALNRREPLDVWAYPSAAYAGQDYGMYFPPEEGDHVWAWFDHGNPMIPGISGGWWLAPRSNSETSHVPFEFKDLTPGISPSRRGIKTKKGHGLLFDDSTTTPKVQLWSGQQAAPSVNAVKNNKLELSDEPGLERATLETLIGHALRLIDAPVGFNGVVLETITGIKLFFDVTFQLAKIETPAGREIILDDLNAISSVIGLTGQIDIDDASQSIDITSIGKVNITGNGVTIDSQTGTQEQIGAGGLFHEFSGDAEYVYNSNFIIGVNGNAEKNIVGTYKESIIGDITHEYDGSVNSKVLGNVDDHIIGQYQKRIQGASILTFIGGLIMAITGSFAIGGALTTAASLTVGAAAPAAVSLGTLAGVLFRLVTEQFILLYNANVTIHNANVNIFNTHNHVFIETGSNGIPQFTSPSLMQQVRVTPADPATTTTTTTVAN